MGTKSKGVHIGRITDLGVVTYYFSRENLYEVTCNCGEVFTAKVAAAKLGSLGCKDCIRAMQASHGKKGRNKQVKELGTPNPSEFYLIIEENK